MGAGGSMRLTSVVDAPHFNVFWEISSVLCSEDVLWLTAQFVLLYR
jgi:hypothetical protein